MAEAQSTLQIILEGRDASASAVLKSFGTQLQEVGRLAVSFAAGNILANLGTDIKDRVEEAVGAVIKLGLETAKLQRVIGGSAEDVSGMIALFNRWGISADQAQLRLTMFSRAVAAAANPAGATGSPGGKAGATVLESLGVNVRDSDTGALRSTLDILKDVAGAVQGLPEIQRTADLTALFGRGAAQLLPLFNQGSEGISKFIEEAQKLGVVIGQDTVDKTKALAAAQHELQMGLEGVSIQLGSVLLPGLVSLVTTLNSTVIPVLVGIPTFVQQVAGSIQELGQEFPVAAGLIAAAITITLLPAFVSLATVAGTAAVGVITAFGPIILILAGLIIGGVLLQKAWETNFGGIRDIVANTFASIQQNWQVALSVLIPFAGFPLLAQKLWQDNFLGIQDVVNGVINAIADKIGGLMDWLAEHGLAGVNANWRDGWKQFADSAGQGAVNVVDKTKDVFGSATTSIKDLITKATGDGGPGQHLADIWQQVGDKIKAATTVQAPELGEAADQAAKELSLAEQMKDLTAEQKGLESELADMAGKRQQIEEQAVLAREKLLGLSAQNAANDLAYEQKRLQLKIQADALAGRGVNPEDINALRDLALRKPQTELNALEAGRPAELTQRGNAATDLARTIAQAPLQEQLADVQAQIASKQAEIDQLKAHPANAGNTTNVGGVNITQHIDNAAGDSGGSIVEKTVNAVLSALGIAQQQEQSSAPPFLPGSRQANGAGPF